MAKRKAFKDWSRKYSEVLDLAWMLELKLEGLADGLDKGNFLDLVTFLDFGLRGGEWWYICYYGKYWKEADL